MSKKRSLNVSGFLPNKNFETSHSFFWCTPSPKKTTKHLRGTINLDSLAPLSLFLAEVENQEATKRPRISSFKSLIIVQTQLRNKEMGVTCWLEAMGVIYHLHNDHGEHPQQNPSIPYSISGDLDGNETSLNTYPFFLIEQHATPPNTFLYSH